MLRRATTVPYHSDWVLAWHAQMNKKNTVPRLLLFEGDSSYVK